jgi:hypothetical protein
MRLEPRLKYYTERERLTLNSINSIIRRIEYGAELASGLRLIAGEGITFEGGKIKALKQDEYPALPIGVKRPTNPTLLSCTGSVGWSKVDSVGFDVCPTVGPPCAIGEPSCAGKSVSGYIVSSAIWPKSCLSTRSPACSFVASFDNFGSIGTIQSSTNPCQVATLSGVTVAQKGSYDAKHFFVYIEYKATNSVAGGPYGFTGAGSFLLQ